MVMSTTKNKTRTKYSKEVTKKWRSQFLIMFDKMDFFMIQPVIEYLFKKGNLRLQIKYIYIYIYIGYSSCNCSSNFGHNKLTICMFQPSC